MPFAFPTEDVSAESLHDGPELEQKRYKFSTAP